MVKVGILALSLSLEEKLSVSLFGVMSPFGLSYMTFIMLRYIPSESNLLKDLILKCSLLSSAFLHQSDQYRM
jgi:hypothetical protein